MVMEQLFYKLDQFTHTMLVFSLFFLAIVLLIAASRPIIKHLQRVEASGLKAASWNNARGIVFGADRLGRVIYSPSDREGHVFCLGGSGSGKTSCLLIPTLQKFSGNYFAIDISGDITANVHRKNSLVFEPCSADTIPYDVFALIDGMEDIQDKHEQLEKLSFLLMPDIPGASDASLFFTNEGRKILTASLIAFYFSGMDFTDICRKIISSSYTELFREIDAQGNEEASLYIKSFRGTNAENTGGCKQSVDAAVKLFALNRNIRRCVHRPGGNQIAFTPQTLEKSCVIFRLDETLLDVYAPLLSIVVSQALTYFASRPIGATPSILFALDEFSSLGKMDIIGALQKLRKRGIRIFVITQSLADLDRIYGEIERKAMLNNFLYKAILGAGVTDTQEYFSKMIGHKQEKSYSRTTGRGAASITERQEKTWAIEPDELGRLQKNLILLHPAGYEKLKKCPYFKH